MIDIRRYPLVSDQVSYDEVAVILRELERVLDRDVTGDIVEFGCYEGTASLFLQRVLAARGYDRQLHVYDSFEGLPPKTEQDSSPAGEQFRTGELHASRSTLVRHFKRAGLQLPVIHKGWFDDLSDTDIPHSIAFAFLDGDYYDSIHTSLRLIEPSLSSGACIVIDDYQSEALPGTRKAVDKWIATRNWPCRPEQSLAIVNKPSH